MNEVCLKLGPRVSPPRTYNAYLRNGVSCFLQSQASIPGSTIGWYGNCGSGSWIEGEGLSQIVFPTVAFNSVDCLLVSLAIMRIDPTASTSSIRINHFPAMHLIN